MVDPMDSVDDCQTGDIFDGVLFSVVFFSHEMSWVRAGTKLSQFLKLFLSTPIKRQPTALPELQNNQPPHQSRK